MHSYRSKSYNQVGDGTVRSSSPVAEARRKFEGNRRMSRPTPAERDMHALPSDEEDELARAERNVFSHNGRARSDSFGRNTPSPIPTEHSLQSFDSPSAERRALDSLAAKTSMGGNAGLRGAGSASSAAAARYMDSIKARRSVKQPVSYAEPSLNSKLRRGDVYFPKTTPESSREASGHRHEETGKEADEMLKDLAGPVRS
jgi:hypothetical protein